MDILRIRKPPRMKYWLTVHLCNLLHWMCHVRGEDSAIRTEWNLRCTLNDARFLGVGFELQRTATPLAKDRLKLWSSFKYGLIMINIYAYNTT